MFKVKATASWYYSTVIVHCAVPYQYIADLATAAQYEQTERERSCAASTSTAHLTAESTAWPFTRPA